MTLHSLRECVMGVRCVCVCVVSLGAFSHHVGWAGRGEGGGLSKQFI